MEDFENDFDDWSPTSWEQDDNETNEEYIERMEDQDDLIDYYND